MLNFIIYIKYRRHSQRNRQYCSVVSHPKNLLIVNGECQDLRSSGSSFTTVTTKEILERNVEHLQTKE